MLKRILRSIAGIGLLVASACSTLLMGGCAVFGIEKDVQAPFDAFVCFDASFNDCVKTINVGDINSPISDDGTPIFDEKFIVQDKDSAKELTSSDGKYRCEYGKIRYIQKIDVTQRTLIVFVSPIVLNQIGESVLRLNRSRESCKRLIQTYEFQLDLLKLQDSQAFYQVQVQYLSAQIENENLKAAKIGTGPLSGSTNPQIKQPGIDEATVLLQARKSVTGFAEQIRNRYKTQTLEVDFQKQFSDGQTLIDTQLREISRELFILDRSTRPLGPEIFHERDRYITGSYVMQGTVVSSMRLKK
ncbi:hypothetical protein BZM27_09395 [Paraburkholderia steynii]|uniref:Uncharacterized protein n=1 Tax=Paraburkholderia steynii TaxID=1245441 RepID=A0A4R0XJ27_9BURK|nr:hypothetical protein BZM27_09395 [Paraburkholderia steynii]